jgi:sugar-specific transcriptional regulator TrmB
MKKLTEQEMMNKLLTLRGDIRIEMDKTTQKFVLKSREIRAYKNNPNKQNNPVRLKWSTLSNTSKEAISNAFSILKQADKIIVYHCSKNLTIYKYIDDEFQIISNISRYNEKEDKS